MGNITIPETLYDGSLFTKKLMSNLNFVNDKIWVSADAPVLPFPGQMWWDSDASTLSVWTGAVWYQIYPASVGGTLVKVSGNDTTANYLGVKLVAGTGVILTELYNGGDERLEVKIGQAVGITDSPVFAGLTVNGNIIVSGTVDGLDLQMHNHGGPNHGEAVDHINLINKGSNTHAQIDTHISTGNIHFLESSISHLNIQNRGTNTHAQIDLHIANTSNPHSVTYTQVGAIQNANDTVKDTHIDWGLAANQVSAVDIPIADTGNYFTSSDVEGALQEAGSKFYWTRDTGNGYLYPATITDKVGVGVSIPEQMLDVKGKFQVWDEGPNNVGLAYLKSYYQSNGCGGVSIWRSRGTKASPGNLLPEDYVGVIEFRPYYSNNWLFGADILVQVVAPVYSGSPSRMRFRTVRDGDMVPDEKFRIEPNSVVFNYDKKNYDFQIKGVNKDYLVYVDMSADKVGFGTNVPNEILTLEGALSMAELGTSPVVSTNYGKVYCKTDKKLYFKDGNDVEYNLLTSGNIPGGLIAIWHGLISNIPAGWVLCDGTNNTPDLRSKFVRGAPAGQNPGTTGGSDTHTLTQNEIPGHTHSIGSESSHTHSWSTISSGDHQHTIQDSGSHKHQHKSGNGLGPDANIPLVWSGYGWRDDTQNWAGNHSHGGYTGYGSHSHSGTTGAGSTHTHSCGSTGGGLPHNNMPAYYEVAFIMKT